MLLLNGIVGQMSVYVARVVVELLATSPDVAFLVPVCLESTAVGGNQGVTPNIEFPIFIEEGIDVLLDKCAFPTTSQVFDCLDDAVPPFLN